MQLYQEVEMVHENVTLVYNALVDLDKRFLVYNIWEDFPVYGQGGFLDSLDLVRLILSIESELSKREGKAISLSSEKAMSYKNNPYKTFFSLVEFAEECLPS